VQCGEDRCTATYLMYSTTSQFQATYLVQLLDWRQCSVPNQFFVFDPTACQTGFNGASELVDAAHSTVPAAYVENCGILLHSCSSAEEKLNIPEGALKRTVKTSEQKEKDLEAVMHCNKQCPCLIPYMENYMNVL